MGRSPGAQSRKALASLPAFALVLAGCGGQAAEPDLLAEAPPPPPASSSRFSAPVEYDFSGVLAVLEREVPARFGSLDSVHALGMDPRKRFAFEAKRGPFTAYADGKLLHLRATVSYAARGYYKPIIGPTVSAGCGGDDQRPRIVLELATPLTVTKDWHLASHARVARLEPASSEERDRCQVSVLKLDVTPKVVGAARSALEKHLRDIDKRVATVDLRERVAGWWGTLSRPIRLSDGVWLVLAPERVAIGGITGDGHLLTVPVSVEARPRIVTSPVEPPADARALPALARAGGGADGFHVVLDGIVDYATASRALTGALGGKRVEQAGHAATIRQVTASAGPRGRLELAVDFEGDARGTLRLSGTPTLDRAGGAITVPDLDYDLDTDNQLLDAYAWLRSDALRSTLREKAHIPAAPALQRGRELLAKGLNRPLGKTAQLSGSVDSVGIRALYATRAGLVVRAVASGQAGLAVASSKPAREVVAAGRTRD